MTKKRVTRIALMTAILMDLMVAAVAAGEAHRMKMTTEIPKSIMTPDTESMYPGT